MDTQKTGFIIGLFTLFVVLTLNLNAQSFPLPSDSLSIKLTFDSPQTLKADQPWKGIKKLAKIPDYSKLIIYFTVQGRKKEKVFKSVVFNQWNENGEHDETATLREMEEQEKHFKKWADENLF